jgi:hypothetical protein
MPGHSPKEVESLTLNPSRAGVVPARKRHAHGVVAAVAVGALILCLAATRARSLILTGRGLRARQATWLPGVGFGVVAAALMAPWAPLPVLRDDEADAPAKDASDGEFPDSSRPPTTIVAAVVLVVVGLILLAESFFLKTPLTQQLATVALVMAPSTLLTIKPLDGAALKSRGLLAGAGLLSALLLLAVGVI